MKAALPSFSGTLALVLCAFLAAPLLALALRLLRGALIPALILILLALGLLLSRNPRPVPGLPPALEEVLQQGWELFRTQEQRFSRWELPQGNRSRSPPL